jgi:hypothetical protein
MDRRRALGMASSESESGSGSQPELRLGAHVVTFEPPDLITARLHGDITEEMVRAFYRFLAEVTAGKGHIMVLIDLGDLGEILRETRRSVTRRPDLPPYRGMVFYNATFQARVTLKFLLLAVNLITRNRDNPLVFCDSEAEGRRWIEERRRTLAREEQRS